MAEKWEYPATGSPTLSFIPALDPGIAASSKKVNYGVVLDTSAGSQDYLYAEGKSFALHRRAFDRNAAADKTAFEAFIAGVLGAPFKFTDYANAAHTVTFTTFEIEYKPAEGDRWSWTVEMKEML